MIAAALILLILAALLVLWILIASDTSQSYDLSIGGLSIHVNAIVVFVLGAVTALLVLSALRLMVAGTRRSARQRRERKDLEKRAAAVRKERDEAVALREKDSRIRGDGTSQDRGHDGHSATDRPDAPHGADRAADTTSDPYGEPRDPGAAGDHRGRR